MENNWFYFGDLDPIFKVAGGLRLLDNGLSAGYLLNEWMDFDQTCTAILLRQSQELIRFLWPWSHFQGYTRAMILENGLSAPYLIEEWMNFDQTYI